jgi:activating signal cointegrator complex subunit 2
MCCCYPSSSALKRLLSDVWNKHEETISSSLEEAKTAMTNQLSALTSASTPEIISDIRLLTILGSTLPASGQVLMAGSDFLDTCYDAYETQKRDDFRRVLVAVIYIGLTSLLKSSKPNLSSLLDQLFSLKASAGVGTKKDPTLLSDVICSSDLLARLERYLISHPQKRGQDLLSSLRAYQRESNVFHHRYQKQKRKLDKGKTRASDPDDMHLHQMSLVTQVQDLFPGLGSGYIIRLLDFYGDNPETIIAHLLDDSITPELQALDKSEQLPTSQTATHHDPFPPRPTPPETAPPTRKNIFDQDVDLAELARSAETEGKLQFGRANPEQTADDLLSNRSINKAAILSALASFDSDDDERDDTYDVADVGGTVDAAAAADADKAADASGELDMTLYRAYRATPGLFGRDSATRRSQPRAALKRETGMTDEAIEGWAVMLSRDPKRVSRLEDRLAVDGVGGSGALAQPELKPTAYRRPGPKGDGESGSDTDGLSGSGRGGSGRGRGRGRGGGGRGGGGRGRGGGADSGSKEQSNAASRQRKEENKASRANHNRRQQRAKKVARAGGMVG